MPDLKSQGEVEDDGCTGFNLNTQKLHCLIVLDDQVAKALSDKAGEAFCRAFVVEERQTGEIKLNFRFRYTSGDSWYRVRLDPEKQKLSREERVEHLAKGFEHVLRMGAGLFAGGIAVPDGVITRFCPPDPDDGMKTLEWLIAQDLVEIKEIVTPEGHKVPVSKGAETVT